eukprot:Phypoly_transcript_13758.p1 GENE.Phypoly_transcript_13758~~Phypoly_transcript_13758.p1  ORF type:complete len:236 (+),score=37.04 Phypoly_transcript_13758:297-1004(+)
MAGIWVPTSCPVSAVRITAQDAKCWAIDAGGDLFQIDSGVWQQVTTPSSFPLTEISASTTDFNLLAVDSSGMAYELNFGFWNQVYVSINPVVSGTLADASDMLLVDSTNAIIQYSSGAISSLPSGPTQLSSTAGLANIWGVDQSSGVVYQYNSATSSWSSVSGKTLAQVHVSLSSSGSLQVVGVDSAGAGWSYNTSASTWSAIPAIPGANFAILEAGAGYLWGLTTMGDVYQSAF